jgi:hypothetical protein
MSLAKRWSKPALADARRRRVGSVSVSVFIVLVLAVTGVELTAATDEEGSADDGDDDELVAVPDEEDEEGAGIGSELFMAMGTRRDDKGEALRHPSCTAARCFERFISLHIIPVSFGYTQATYRAAVYRQNHWQRKKNEEEKK